jgi:hypothetical protein
MMKIKYKLLIIFAGIILLLVTYSTLAAVEAFSLDWWTVDGGGAKQVGGDYQLLAVAGQPEAGTILYGGEFGLSGGFLPGLPGEASPRLPLFLPLIMR